MDLPATVRRLARSHCQGEDCGFALRDALLEAGHAECAELVRDKLMDTATEINSAITMGPGRKYNRVNDARYALAAELLENLPDDHPAVEALRQALKGGRPRFPKEERDAIVASLAATLGSRAALPFEFGLGNDPKLRQLAGLIGELATKNGRTVEGETVLAFERHLKAEGVEVPELPRRGRGRSRGKK
jgi:hypothetical protein